MISQEKLKQLLDYNPDTGIFIWKVKIKSINPGDIAGGLMVDGYYRIKIEGISYKGHRLAWLYMTNEWPNETIDHINNNRSDNRFENLRKATITENNHNRLIGKNNTSGYKGVTFHKFSGKWQASIRHNGKRYYLGHYKTPELADKACREFREKMHGEFVNHG